MIDFREKVTEAEKLLRTCVQEEIPLTHTFAPQAYARTVIVPAETMVITKIHKTDHITVMSQGEALVTTEEGTDHLVAPLVFVTKAGTKRAVYTLTEVFWTTFHVTESQDLEQIEQEVIAPSYEVLENGKAIACRGSQSE